MRSFAVELLDKGIELGLLLQKVSAGPRLVAEATNILAFRPAQMGTGIATRGHVALNNDATKWLRGALDCIVGRCSLDAWSEMYSSPPSRSTRAAYSMFVAKLVVKRDLSPDFCVHAIVGATPSAAGIKRGHRATIKLIELRVVDDTQRALLHNPAKSTDLPLVDR